MLSSHLLDEVERTCDAVAIVDRGRVVRQGPIDELIGGAGASVVQVACDDPTRAKHLIDEAGIAAATALTDAGVAVTLLPGASCDAVADINRRIVAAGISVYRLREDKVVSAHVLRRADLPPHYSVAAVERSNTRLKEMLRPRRFCFRNAGRTNRLVGLMRLELNGQGNERDYAVIVRDHLAARGGDPGRQPAVTDKQSEYSIRPWTKEGPGLMPQTNRVRTTHTRPAAQLPATDSDRCR